MKRIFLLTTGGTIAMSQSRAMNGAVPTLTGIDFLKALPHHLADVRVEEFCNVPSAHLTLDDVWHLSRRIAALVAQDDVDGVVVTHGTDTLEESAYLCDVTIDTPKPIVFTGAMRTANTVGYDGIANLIAAIRVAACDAARACGTLVVMNDEIHTARDVTKQHTTALDTFVSPDGGPLGRVYADSVTVTRRAAYREFIPATRLETNVHLIKLTVGMSEGLLEYLAEVVGALGVVLETLGGGRVPPWWLATIERAINAGVAIVITSRAGAGRTVDEYGYAGAYRDLARLGCWFAHGLNGQKARLKLMAALGTGNARAYFV
jgi:L-asparaginase